MTTNVGYASLQIIPSAKGFTSALSGEIDPKMDKVGKSAGRKAGGGLSAGLLGVAGKVAGPLAAAFAGVQVAGFLKDGISQASDLNETVSKTQQILGQQAMPALTKFSDEAATKLGLTKQAALDAVGTFAIFGKAAGLKGQGLTDFSTKLTTLSGDLASFYNTSTDDAAAAVGSALRGEFEPIRKYGVLLDQASLQQEALRLGIIKNVKTALTPQQRTLAAQAVIMRQTKDAQGDFARTSGGLANQQRILGAQWENIQTTLGSVFLPIVLKVVSALNSGLGPALAFVQKAVSGFGDAFSGSGPVGQVGTAAQSLTAQVGPVFEKIGSLLFDKVIPAMTTLGTTIATTLLPIIRSIAEYFIGTVIPAVLEIYSAIAEALGPAVEALAGFWRDNLGPALQIAWDAFQKVLNVVIPVVKWVAILAVKIIGFLFPIVLKIIGALLGVVGVVMRVAGAIASVIGWIGSFIGSLGGALAAFGGFVGSVVGKAGEILGFFVGLPGKIIGAIGDLAGRLLQVGKDIVGGLIKGIGSMAGSVIDTVKRTITDALPDFVKSALGIQSPSRVFMAIGKWVVLGLRDGVLKNAAGVQKAAKTLVSKLATAQSGLADLQQKAADTAKTVTDSILQTGNVASAKGGFDGIVYGLQRGLAQADAFSTAIKRLKDLGLNGTSLDQIVSAGADGGLASAQALAAAGKDGIAKVNGLQASLNKAAASTGKAASDALYGTGMKAAQGVIDGLKALIPAIVKVAQTLGAKVAAEVSKTLGIAAPKSPSPAATKAASLKTAKAPIAPKTASATKTASAAKVVNVTVNNPKPTTAPATLRGTLSKVAHIGM